jgi:hypothetical protein
MFNLKWSGAAGAFAFALSLLIGLLGGGALIALIRALFFGVFFFALGSLAYWLISRFLPELLDPEDFDDDDDDGEEAGSRVNIAVEGGEDFALPGALNGDFAELDSLPGLGGKAAGEAPGGPGNPAALDQNGEDDYTEKGNGAQFGAGASGESGGFVAIPGDSTNSVDELPDLGNLPSGFLPSGGELETKVSMSPPAIPDTQAGGAGKKPGAGDFNLKEMASAIQTILRKD